jgi:hypothetical protein
VPETARLLGISERAVRKRITAGTLDAHKEGSAWVVLLPATTGAVLAVPAAQEAVPEGAPVAALGGTASPGVDLAPLVVHIEKKDAEIQRLSEAAMMWQYRAMRAEERLAQLEPGPIAQDAGEFRTESVRNAPQDAIPAPVSDDATARASESLIARVRRLIGRGGH